MQHTSNYNLPQWEASDPIKRADFNSAMQTLDTAVKAASDAAGAGTKIAYGTYTGNGYYGSGSKNSLTFAFQPKLILVQSRSGGSDEAIFALQGQASAALFPGNRNTDPRSVTLEWNGNTVSWYNSDHGAYQLNYNGKEYAYIAIG